MLSAFERLVKIVVRAVFAKTEFAAPLLADASEMALAKKAACPIIDETGARPVLVLA